MKVTPNVTQTKTKQRTHSEGVWVWANVIKNGVNAMTGSGRSGQTEEEKSFKLNAGEGSERDQTITIKQIQQKCEMRAEEMNTGTDLTLSFGSPKDSRSWEKSG